MLAAISQKGLEASLKVAVGLGQAGVGDVPDPDLSSQPKRRRFREKVAGAVLRGKLAEKIANTALRAAADVAAEEQVGFRLTPGGPDIHITVNVLAPDGSSRTISVGQIQPTLLPPPQLASGDDP